MRILYIQYALWKSIAQAQGFATFHKVVQGDDRSLWAGHPELIYQADVDNPADYADWQANFEGSSTLVPDEDAAVANITGLGATLQPRKADGTPVMASRNLQLGQSKFVRTSGGAKMNIDGRTTGTPVVLWNGTGGGDTGGDYDFDNGIGSETAGAMHSGTNGWDTGVAALNDQTRFEDSGGDSDIGGTYDVLTFWIQPKAFPPNSRLRVQWQNAANTVVGANLNVESYVTNMDLDVWQRVSIPMEDFNLDADVAKLRFRYRNTAGQHYFIDEIELVPPGGGPYRFRVEAPDAQTCYHISMLVILISAPASGWDADNFGHIVGGLENGLLFRQKQISTGDTLWALNSKSNIDLFGRFHPQDDITFADGDLMVGFMVKPGKASIVVTDDDVIDVVVRDDLSTITEMRAFAHYGIEVRP